MSIARFLELMQALLTMVDPTSESSIKQVAAILKNLEALGQASGKMYSSTLTAIRIARNNLNYLVETRENFAGTPGDFRGNEAKRRRLYYALTPHC